MDMEVLVSRPRGAKGTGISKAVFLQSKLSVAEWIELFPAYSRPFAFATALHGAASPEAFRARFIHRWAETAPIDSFIASLPLGHQHTARIAIEEYAENRDLSGFLPDVTLATEAPVKEIRSRLFDKA